MNTRNLFGESTAAEDLGTPYVMRESCRYCLKEGKEILTGFARESGGQNVIRCAMCKRQCYNAPKAETGTPQRNVKSRPDLKFGQRERILLKCGGRCFLCGRSPQVHGVNLHIAHLVSVAGNKTLEHPLSDDVLYSDANLAAACEECNLGMGTRSIEPEILARLVLLTISRNGG